MIQSIADRLLWLGHDGFRLSSSDKTIYFDPYKIADNLPPADLLLISHEHYDHCSPEDIDKIRRPETVILTEPVAAKKIAPPVTTMAPGDRRRVGEITVEAVASYNINKKFHPQTNRWLGFIVTVEGVRVYHAGDTDLIPEMQAIEADIALLPVSGTYVMTAEEAARAAMEIKPQLAIPMHFGSLVGTRDDAQRFASLLDGKIPVRIPTAQQS